MRVQLNEKNEWKHTFESDDETVLYKYKEGKEITYTVEETEVPEGYEMSQVGNVITNTHTPEVTEVTVKKEWDDKNNTYEKRPDKIVVNLKADDEVIKQLTLNNQNEWTETVKDLPKYKAGKEISYTFEEAEVPLYYKVAVASEAGKTTITNTMSTSDLTIEKSVDKIVNVGENKTFVFNVVVTDKDGNKKYENQVGLTISGTDLKGTKTLKGIPAEKDDKVEVTELYSAGYEAGEAQITYDEATNTWKVTVVNTYDDIINGSGAVNSYGELNPTTPDAERYQGGAD